ncbi:diguanylate cyclase domain-containing protein [Aliarcobacter lanthieri]
MKVSIGIAYFSSNSDITRSELLIKADETLYKVKNSGRNNYSIIDI